MNKLVYVDGVPCEYSRVKQAFLSLPLENRLLFRNSFEYYCLRQGFLITSDNVLSVSDYCSSSDLPVPCDVGTIQSLKNWLHQNNIEFYDVVNSKCAAKSHHRVEPVYTTDGIILVEMPHSNNMYYVA